MTYEIKDTGSHRKFESGAQRDAKDGKGRFDLLPMIALYQLAVHYQKGANKYSDRNWEKGMPLSEFVDSGLRHLAEWMLGIEDGEDHLIAAVWNFIGLQEMDSRIKLGILPKELDDIPKALKNVDIEILRQIFKLG